MTNIILCAGHDGRAVIYGSVDTLPVPGRPVQLRDARMVLYWSADCGGLFGLAASGPKTTTRLTQTVATVVETVWQEYLSVSAEAAMAFAAWPSC